MRQRYDILIVSGAALLILLIVALIQRFFFPPTGLQIPAQPAPSGFGAYGDPRGGAMRAPDEQQERERIAAAAIKTRGNQ